MFGSACDKSNPIQSLANLLLLSDQDILDACFYCECAFHKVIRYGKVLSNFKSKPIHTARKVPFVKMQTRLCKFSWVQVPVSAKELSFLTLIIMSFFINFHTCLIIKFS